MDYKITNKIWNQTKNHNISAEEIKKHWKEKNKLYICKQKQINLLFNPLKIHHL